MLGNTMMGEHNAGEHNDGGTQCRVRDADRVHGSHKEEDALVPPPQEKKLRMAPGVYNVYKKAKMGV